MAGTRVEGLPSGFRKGPVAAAATSGARPAASFLKGNPVDPAEPTPDYGPGSKTTRKVGPKGNVYYETAIDPRVADIYAAAPGPMGSQDWSNYLGNQEVGRIVDVKGWEANAEAARSEHDKQQAILDARNSFPSTGAEEYDSYQLKPMSEEEWAQLTSTQQRAVLANGLLYQARNTLSPDKAAEVYDLLGLNDKARADDAGNYATMEDILGLTGPQPGAIGPGQQAEMNDSATLAALRALSNKINRADTTTSTPGALDLDQTLPLDLEQLVGGTSQEDLERLYALPQEYFQRMIYLDRDAMVNTPGVLQGFEDEFGAAIKGLPIDEVKKMFQQEVNTAAASDPTVDVAALLEFYGFGD